MTQQISFSRKEREFMHLLRDRISRSEDSVDLENMFSFTVCGFLSEILKNRKLKTSIEDVMLCADAGPHFRISNTLRNSKEFMHIWRNSDLPDILTKFADTAYHRYMHLAGHPEKTVKKIRNRGKKPA